MTPHTGARARGRGSTFEWVGAALQTRNVASRRRLRFCVTDSMFCGVRDLVEAAVGAELSARVTRNDAEPLLRERDPFILE